MTDKLAKIANQPKQAIFFILLVAIMTHLPTSFSSFVADDFMQWAMVHGSDTLHEKGFSKAHPDKPLLEKLKDGFHFFSHEAGTNQEYRNYGNLFWWASNEASMVPFRPLAAATHWFDYQLFGDKLYAHRIHTLIYFLLLSIVLYLLFQKIEPDSRVVLFATMLMVVDFSLTKSFNWVVARNSIMACALGVISILFFIDWRQHQEKTKFILCVVFLVLGLLTAEAAISAVAYMGAYVLCVERQPLLKKALPMMPFIIIIVAWRVLYNQGGFGASEIGQYVDPGRSPVEFFSNFLTVFPLICLSLITGVDTLIIFVHPEKKLLVASISWVVAIGCVYFVWPYLAKNRIARFMFVGSIVAAIPGTALISAEGRTVTFVSIGFFYLLALWLVNLYRQNDRFLPRWGFRLVTLWHLILPALIAFVWTANLTGFSQASSQYQSVKNELEKGDSSLVVVNPSASGMLYYLPFEWAFYGYPVPKQLNVLTPGLNTIQLSRVDQRTFVIKAPSGMPLHHNAGIKALNGKEPVISPVYTGIYTQSFFVQPEDTPKQGETIRNGDMEVTIRKTNTVGPTEIEITFVGVESPDEKIWQWFDWKTLVYKAMTPLAVGETRSFPGPLDKS